MHAAYTFFAPWDTGKIGCFMGDCNPSKPATWGGFIPDSLPQ